jgi:hypothetical protein
VLKHTLQQTLLLALFVFSVAANHPHRSFAADDFAVLTDAFDAGSDFHVLSPYRQRSSEK